MHIKPQDSRSVPCGEQFIKDNHSKIKSALNFPKIEYSKGNPQDPIIMFNDAGTVSIIHESTLGTADQLFQTIEDIILNSGYSFKTIKCKTTAVNSVLKLKLKQGSCNDIY